MIPVMRCLVLHVYTDVVVMLRYCLNSRVRTLPDPCAERWRFEIRFLSILADRSVDFGYSVFDAVTTHSSPRLPAQSL